MVARTIQGQISDHARPSSGGVRETGCREAAMAGKRLFSGGAKTRLSIANQNTRPPTILRFAAALQVQPPGSRSEGRP